MTSVFVDTSALIALGNRRDRFHESALRLFDEYELKRHFVTTTAVILELLNTFSAVKYKQIAGRLIDMIYESENWTVITVAQRLMKEGIAMFKKMKDKDWSLVDCLSMIIAEKRGINEIFTNDHHFEQADFKILLK